VDARRAALQSFVQLAFEVADNPEVPSAFALSNVSEVPFRESVAEVTSPLPQLTGQ